MPSKYSVGVLVTVVDEVAGDFVFGPHGTIGRPQGLMTGSVNDKLHSAKLLSSVCQEKLAGVPSYMAECWMEPHRSGRLCQYT